MYNDDYLAHHGILGQRWGFRRYQNPDGSLTEAGKRRYAKAEARIRKKEAKRERKRLKREAKEQAKKEKIMLSANPKKILSYQDKLTLQELNVACQRAQMASNLKNISRQPNRAVQALNTGVSVMNSIYQGTELVSKLNKTFLGDKSSLKNLDVDDAYNWVRNNVTNGKGAEEVVKYLAALDRANNYKPPKKG